MNRMPLSLDPNNSGAREPENKPVMGWAGVGFGFLGVFVSGFFVPVGLICSLIALFTGQAAWGLIGILVNIVGLLTSPALLAVIGMGAFAMWFDWNDFIKPLLDMFGMGGVEV